MASVRSMISRSGIFFLQHLMPRRDASIKRVHGAKNTGMCLKYVYKGSIWSKGREKRCTFSFHISSTEDHEPVKITGIKRKIIKIAAPTRTPKKPCHEIIHRNFDKNASFMAENVKPFFLVCTKASTTL